LTWKSTMFPPPRIVIEVQNISNCFRLLGYPNSIVTFHTRRQVLWGLYDSVNNMKYTEVFM